MKGVAVGCARAGKVHLTNRSAECGLPARPAGFFLRILNEGERFSASHVRAGNHMFEYARGSVHINSCENFFCLLRRGLKGTYVRVRADHLEAYVDEQAFRYSWRKESDWTRFDRLMHRVLGERLPYSQLTGGKKR